MTYFGAFESFVLTIIQARIQENIRMPRLSSWAFRFDISIQDLRLPWRYQHYKMRWDTTPQIPLRNLLSSPLRCEYI